MPRSLWTLATKRSDGDGEWNHNGDISANGFSLQDGTTDIFEKVPLFLPALWHFFGEVFIDSQMTIPMVTVNARLDLLLFADLRARVERRLHPFATSTEHSRPGEHDHWASVSGNDRLRLTHFRAM